MSKVLIPVLAVAYALFPDGSAFGFYSGSGLAPHFYYMFFHGGILHLACNCYSLFFLLRRCPVRGPVLLPALYIVAVLSSFAGIADTPTIGASGIVFALLGIRMYGCRTASGWGLCLLFLVVGLLLPGANGAVHLSAFCLGLLFFAAYTRFNRIIYDYRGYTARER